MIEDRVRFRSWRSRKLMAAAVLTSGVLVVAGCTSSSDKNVGSSSTSNKVGGTLVDLLPTLVKGLDTDDVGGTSNNPLPQAYNPLVAFSTTVQPDGLRKVDFATISPLLASSWTDDNGTYTFKLRQGVMSCAGNEFTADDVVWTLSRIKSVTGAATTSLSALNVANVFDPTITSKTAPAAQKQITDEVTKVDKYTVKIKVRQDNGLLLDALASPLVSPIDSVEAKKNATPDDPWAHTWLHTHTAGFGPYCTSSFTPGSAATLTANKGYTVKKPYFQQVQMKAVPQSANRLAALQKGEAQIAEALTNDEYASAGKAQNTKVLSTYGTLNIALSMNYNYAPWGPNGAAAATAMRHAVASAVPYDSIVKDSLGGVGKTMNGLIPDISAGAKTYPGVLTTDVAKAKQYLAAAGYPDGNNIPPAGLQLFFAAESATQLQPIAIQIQSALAAIGVKITLNPIPQAQLQTRVYINNDVPMVLQVIGAGIPDSTYYTQLWYVPTKDGGTTGLGAYNDPKVTALYQQAAVSKGAQRETLIGQAQDILIQDLPMFPVAAIPLEAAVDKKLTGVQVSSFGPDYALVSES